MQGEVLKLKSASCLGHPTLWWFPERQGKTSSEIRESFANTKKATDICKGCPCLAECLTYSIKNYEIGIWGGMGEKLRKRARRMLLLGMPIHLVIEKLLGVEEI